MTIEILRVLADRLSHTTADLTVPEAANNKGPCAQSSTVVTALAS